MTPPLPRTSIALRGAQWLALGITLLLFAQWPLRDAPGGAGVLANDVAQILFALYVAVAIGHTAARGGHLTAHPEALQRSRWRRVGAALVPLPWCAWLLVTSGTPVAQSLMQLEHFSETLNPGYFVIKLALVVLALGLAGQSLRALRVAWLSR
jgi:hypothetical protein